MQQRRPAVQAGNDHDRVRGPCMPVSDEMGGRSVVWIELGDMEEVEDRIAAGPCRENAERQRGDGEGVEQEVGRAGRLPPLASF